MTTIEAQPAVPESKLRSYQYSLRTLLVVVTLFAILCSALLTFWTFVVCPAREAGRRAACPAKVRILNHACLREVVFLTQNNRVASVSTCPVCCQLSIDHAWWDGPIRFVDSRGMLVDESAVPPKAVEEAKVRLRENRQELMAQLRDATANTPQPQSGSPQGGAGRGKMVN